MFGTARARRRSSVVVLLILALLAPASAAGASSDARCPCTEGPCCDGCHFLGPEHVCAGGAAEELSCEPADGCGGVSLWRHASRMCSGTSAACDGVLSPFGPWLEHARCGVEEACVAERPVCRRVHECRCGVRCDDADPCTIDTCADGGGCVQTPLACEDDDPCTSDACVEGVCVHGTPDCNDGNGCTDDVCVNGVGCLYWPRDGLACLAADGQAGVCWAEACCVPGCGGRVCGGDGCGGQCGACDDGNLCTLDLCSDDGSCSHSLLACDDEIDCTVDICTDGVCSHSADDERCEDGRTCSADRCTPAGCQRDEAACGCLDDDWEDNDDPETASALPEGAPLDGLQVVYGDEDWWRFEAAAGSLVRVELRVDGGPGNVDDLVLEVRDECDVLASPVTEGDASVVSAVAQDSGRLHVRVSVRPVAACRTYGLALTVVPPALPPVTCNVPCPYLEGYAPACNAQNHCEYRRPDAQGWEVADVLIWVPPGSFPFGRGDDLVVTFERGYWVDKYEATAGGYAAFLDANGSNLCPVSVGGAEVCVGPLCWEGGNLPPFGREPVTLASCPLIWNDRTGESRIASQCAREPHGPLGSCRDHPVSTVTWFGARAFCRWRGADLCSESEWERAGKGWAQREYPWGDAPRPGDPDWEYELADLSMCSGPRCPESTEDYTYLGPPVTAMPRGASPAGAYHMAGHVAEWVLDTGALDGTNGSPSPDVPRDGTAWEGGDPRERVYRGAPWDVAAFMNRGAAEAWHCPEITRPDIYWVAEHWLGFRCCRSRPCRK